MIEFSNVRRIIVDLDGTFIDHVRSNEAEELSEILGINYTTGFESQIKEFFKNNEKDIANRKVTYEYFEYLISYMIPTLKQNNKTGREFLNALNLREHKLMSGAKETLEYLYEKRKPIVALTNWFATEQIEVLKKLDILQYFERIYGFDNNFAKPHKDAFIRALDYTDPESVVMIGDSILKDIFPAKCLGIKTIGYNIDKEKYSIQKYRPDLYVEHLLEITNVF